MKKDLYYVGFGSMLVFFLLLPYLINWDNSYITIHDYLDGVFIFPEIIQQNHALWEFDATMPFMHGISRNAFPMTYPWEIKPLINFLFPGYAGVYINILFVKLIAFIGMWLLLDRYVSNIKWISFVVSLIYAMIPFYVDFGLSSAGIPLLSYALLNLKNGKNIAISYFFVIFFALYSSFALSGLFVCFVLFMWILALWYEQRKLNKHLAISLIVLTLLYVSTNWALIQDFLVGSDFVSHRVEWNIEYTLSTVLNDLINDELVISQYHAGSFIALPIVLLFFIVYIRYRKSDSTLNIYFSLYFILALLIIIGTSAKMLPLAFFKSFQLDRFSFLYAAMCFVLLGKTCEVLWMHNKRYLSGGALVIAFACVGVKNSEFIANMKMIVGIEQDQATLAQFYDKDLFAKIAKEINVPQDYSVRVVSVGMFPSVASYNGFWSLDGYMSSYSLDYKHQFRKIISNELAKNNQLQTYFDDWGSRCYVFSSELDNKKNRYLLKKENLSVNNLDIDTKALKSLGCNYIFSSVDINNFKDLNLKYIDSFTSNNSFWNIRVYKLL